MSNMEHYAVWYEIKISHDYYPDNFVPLELLPTNETRIYMLRNNILLRKNREGYWSLLKPAGEKPEEKEAGLSFEIRITSPDFYYVTGRDVRATETSYTLSDPQYPSAWKIFTIQPLETEEEVLRQINWKIPTVEMYFEYICIPKYSQVDLHLKMIDDKNEFQIKGPEKVDLAGDKEVLRFVTKDPIPLRNTYKYKMQLWEVRDSGERLMSDNIPCPNPSERSIYSPNDTITTYYYF